MGTSFSPSGQWPQELMAARELLVAVLPNHRDIYTQLRPVVHTGITPPTMRVDDRLRVFYNPAVFTLYTPDEIAAILYHEVEHWRREHHARAETLHHRLRENLDAGRYGQIVSVGIDGRQSVHLDPDKPEHAQWIKHAENLAMDAEINCSRVFRGGPLTLPAAHISPELLGQEPGKVWELYMWAAIKSYQDEQAGLDQFARDLEAWERISGVQLDREEREKEQQEQEDDEDEDGEGEPEDFYGLPAGEDDDEESSESEDDDEDDGADGPERPDVEDADSDGDSEDSDDGEGESDEPGYGDGVGEDDDEADEAGEDNGTKSSKPTGQNGPESGNDRDESESKPSVPDPADSDAGADSGEESDPGDGVRADGPDGEALDDAADEDEPEDDEDGGWACSEEQDFDEEELDRIAADQGVDGAPDELIDALRDQAAEASAQNRGVEHGAASRWAKWHKESRRDYLKELSRHVGRAITTQGQTNYTWSRPSRRVDAYANTSGYIPPKLIAQLPTICIVIDSSGSITTEMIDKAWSEARAICRVYGPVMCVVGDDRVQKVIRADGKRESLMGVGGGSTDMPVLYDHVLKHFPEVECIINFTDGFTNWPEKKLRVPLIVCLIGDYDTCVELKAGTGRYANWQPPAWATTILAADPVIPDGVFVRE